MRMLRNSTRILGGAFILSLTLSAQTFTTLYSFCTQDYEPCSSQAGVILGPHGELYGTTDGGGRWSDGTVFELLPPASPGGAWTAVVLHSFNDVDGGQPTAGLTMGPNGALYGVTPSFGASANGTAFRLDPPTGTSTDWTYAVINQFPEVDGNLSGSLVFGSSLGHGQSLYGSTTPGTVYRLTPPAAPGDAWTQTNLYTFPSGWGTTPVGSLAVGTGGKLFGVTLTGGTTVGPCTPGCATVFSLTPPAAPGGPWTEGVLHAFSQQTYGIEGGNPMAGVVIGPEGVLYGATSAGGAGGGGVAFTLTPPVAPGEPMTFTILYSFGLYVPYGVGSSPATPLVLGPNGVLYGTTQQGGNGSGTVFELTPPASPGGTWTGTILHSFTDQAEGGYPNGLTLAPDGTLYGTTSPSVVSGGIVFALTP